MEEQNQKNLNTPHLVDKEAGYQVYYNSFVSLELKEKLGQPVHSPSRNIHTCYSNLAKRVK